MARHRSLLLAHHHEDYRGRCATVADHDVCRRCLVLYPVLLATMVAVTLGVGSAVPVWWRNPLVWLLPLPAALEYGAETLGLFRYRPRRQVAVTAVSALAGGAGFAWERQAPTTVSAWTAAIAYGTCAVVLSVIGWRRQSKARSASADRAALAATAARLESIGLSGIT